jgi:SAM-dependent methyltransferase
MKNFKKWFSFSSFVAGMLLTFVALFCYKAYKRYEANKYLYHTGPISLNECDKKFELNSKDYWDCRFKTQDWQLHNGDEQTLHFYVLLVNSLPEYIHNELEKNRYSVVDFGCAQGEGTEFFAKAFEQAHVTGVDISTEGIEIAKRKHSKAAFLATDLTESNSKWDILISSNTLEHFYEPWNILNKLSNKINKYMIILVPFDQQGIPNHEHFYSFNMQNIPLSINDFNLVDKKFVYANPKYWGEKQILLVYKKGTISR